MQAGALLGLRHQSVFAGRGKQARVRNSLRACTLFSSGQALRCACSAPFVVVSGFTSCSPRISEWAKKQASMWLPGCRPLTPLRGHSHSPSLPLCIQPALFCPLSMQVPPRKCTGWLFWFIHFSLWVGLGGTIVIGVFTVRGGGLEISQDSSLQGRTGSCGNILCTLSTSLSPSNTLVRMGEAGA